MPWVFLLRGRNNAGPSSVFVRAVLKAIGAWEVNCQRRSLKKHLSYEVERLQPSFTRIGTQFLRFLLSILQFGHLMRQSRAGDCSAG
jgi:hypothetical protein